MPSITVSSTQQTGNTISAGTAAGSLKPQKRTFSLTGSMGTTIVPGDEIQLWGSNDGGSTYQPLRQQGAPVLLNYNNPEVIIDDCCTHYASQRRFVGTGSALAACGFNGEAAQNPLVQAGTVTLASGTATVTGKILTSASIIIPTVVTSGGTMTGFANIDVSSINITAGSFVLTAKSDAPATLGSATPVVNYVIVG